MAIVREIVRPIARPIVSSVTEKAFSWQRYWAGLISATIEDAAPIDVVLTFPTAKNLIASDFTIAGKTISGAVWVGSVLTLTVSVAFVYGDNPVVTFVKTGGTANVTNNITQESEATALIGRMTAISETPSASEQVKINNFYKAIKTGGVLTKADVLHIMVGLGTDRRASAKLNWAKDVHNSTEGGTPYYNRNYGFNGIKLHYLDTGFNPLANGSKFLQDDAAGIVYLKSVLNDSTDPFGAYLTRIHGSNHGPVNIAYYVNSTVGHTLAVTPAEGMYNFMRTSSSLQKFGYNKNAFVNSGSITSGARPNVNVWLCGINNNGSLLAGCNAWIAAHYEGGALTQGESDAFYDALIDYMSDLQPKITSTLILGDSLSAAYSGQNALTTYMPYPAISLATAGDYINTAKADFNSRAEAERLAYQYVFILIGINDLLFLGTSLANLIIAYQDLIDTIRAGTSAGCKIVCSTLLPCKARMLTEIGDPGYLAYYQRWLDFNEAITDGTIIDIDSTVDMANSAMNDGAGNLAAAYNTIGDDLHENNLGRIIIVNAYHEVTNI